MDDHVERTDREEFGDWLGLGTGVVEEDDGDGRGWGGGVAVHFVEGGGRVEPGRWAEEACNVGGVEGRDEVQAGESGDDVGRE